MASLAASASASLSTKFNTYWRKITNTAKHLNRSWLYLVQNIATLPFLIYRLCVDLKHNAIKKNKLAIVTDIKNIAIATSNVILSILSICFVKPILLFAIVIKDLIDSISDLILIAYQRRLLTQSARTNNSKMAIQIAELKHRMIARYQATQKVNRKDLTELTDKLNAQKQNTILLIKSVHRIIIGTITLIASILEFTPFATVGNILLGIISAYSFIDYLGLNPFHIFFNSMSGQSNHRLRLLSENDVAKMIYLEANAKNTSKENKTNTNEQYNTRSQNHPQPTRTSQKKIFQALNSQPRRIIKINTKRDIIPDPQPKVVRYWNDFSATNTTNSLMPTSDHQRSAAYSK